MSFLEGLDNCKVLVVGDIMVDSFVYGCGKRLSQEAPVPVVLVKKKFYKLGGAGNVAANLVALGCRTDICGFVGKDITSRICRDLMRSTGISTDYLVESMHPTILKTRVIADNQHVVRFDEEESFSESLVERLSDVDPQHYNAVIISDYAKGTIQQSVMDLISDRFRDKFVIVDPKPKNHNLYKNVNSITPNLAEARMMTNCEDAINCAKYLQEELNCDFVIVTLSEHGVFMYNKGKSTQLPAYPISTSDLSRRDVTGAGDTLIAAFVAFHCAGMDCARSLVLANIAAAIAVTKIGTEVCSLDELREELSHEEKMASYFGRVDRSDVDSSVEGNFHSRI